MPVIKSAKKKLRKDRKREKINSTLEASLKRIVKKAEKTPTEKSLQEVYRAIDKAAKQKIIHSNKANRMKSQLSKLVKPVKKTSAS